MKYVDWKRGSALLSVLAIIGTLVFYCSIWSRFCPCRPWSLEDLHPNLGPALKPLHESGSSDQLPASLNDLSILLNPDEHTQREPKRIELQWNVSAGTRRPDGVAKRVFLVNGAFPGPTIEARSGDEVVIEVRNQLEDEDVAIHWHGLRIANEMDGVVGLKQCGIRPGKEMEYVLKIPEDQSGSFWWHSHSELQRADGLSGPLVVHKPETVDQITIEVVEYKYDEEQILMVGDWYHRSAEQVLSSYTDWKNFKIEPAPDSLLINGKGHFNCSKALKARPLDCEAAQKPRLVLSGRTRVRIVNTGALTGISIATSWCSMTTVQVDGGHAVEATTSRNLGVLYPGERIDVIFERHEEASAAYVRISIDRENVGFPNLALTAEQQFSIEDRALNEGTRPHTVLSGGKGNVPMIDRLDLS